MVGQLPKVTQPYSLSNQSPALLALVQFQAGSFKQEKRDMTQAEAFLGQESRPCEELGRSRVDVHL